MFLSLLAKVLVKQEDAMETESLDKSLPFGISPGKCHNALYLLLSHNIIFIVRVTLL